MTDFTSTPFTRQFKDDCDELAARLAKKMEEDLTRVMMGPPRKQRQTALRVRGRSFETVELDDDGKVIEPLRCICGGWMHRPTCPFYCMTT